MSRGAILPPAPLSAPADIMAAARANCAERARTRGDVEEAVRYQSRANDLGWAMRHEVARLLAERAAAEAGDTGGGQ